MTQELRILIAGESWETMSIHQKGFDIFTTTFYEEGVGPLNSALEKRDHTVTHVPSHIAATKFPIVLEGLQSYDVVAPVGNDPLLAAWEHHKGHAVAFASDRGPHWAPPEFLAWDGYDKLWSQMVAWAGGAL